MSSHPFSKGGSVQAAQAGEKGLITDEKGGQHGTSEAVDDHFGAGSALFPTGGLGPDGEGRHGEVRDDGRRHDGWGHDESGWQRWDGHGHDGHARSWDGDGRDGRDDEDDAGDLPTQPHRRSKEETADLGPPAPERSDPTAGGDP